MNICVHPAFCYVFQHLALITIKAQNRLFSQNVLDKNQRKTSIYAGFWDLLVYSNYTSPEPILPLFSFVLAGHKGLEDLGRVVVFVLC